MKWYRWRFRKVPNGFVGNVHKRRKILYQTGENAAVYHSPIFPKKLGQFTNAKLIWIIPVPIAHGLKWYTVFKSCINEYNLHSIEYYQALLVVKTFISHFHINFSYLYLNYPKRHFTIICKSFYGINLIFYFLEICKASLIYTNISSNDYYCKNNVLSNFKFKNIAS